MKDLVIYYSWFGNTEVVAKEIFDNIGGDLVKIEEIRERKPNAFMSSAIAAFFGLKSKLKPLGVSLKDYDRIFLGGQVWAGKSTPAINSFLSKADLKGKSVYLFLTKADDKVPQKTIELITRKIEARGGKVKDSLFITTKMKSVISSDEIKEKVSDWIKILGN